MAGAWVKGYLESSLLTWIKFNAIIDKKSHTQYSVGENYISIPKLQRLYRWSLGMEQ